MYLVNVVCAYLKSCCAIDQQTQHAEVAKCC